MRRTLNITLWLVLLTGSSLWIPTAGAQRHVSPPNGEKGVPGPLPRSFSIEWEAVPGAIGYEYVLSDNPLCFSGCPGDTRQGYVTGTSATEYNLQEDTWYYWITRVYYSETEVGAWSSITSFLAETPELFSRIAEVAPNPAAGRIMVHVDWGISPVARFITIELYDLLGRRIIDGIRFEKSNPRFQVFEVPIGSLAAGTYLVVFLVDGNPNNVNNRAVQTIIIL